MDLREYFRTLFGLGGRQHRDHNWNIPPAGPDEEHHEGCSCHDDDVHDNDLFAREDDNNSESQFFFGNGGHPLDDMFRHFHGDMNRQMEFLQRQMEDMMRGFGTIASGNLPPNRPGAIDQPESDPSNRVDGPPFFHFKFSVPGHPDTRKDKKSPRDFMLKDDEDVTAPKSLPPVPSPPLHENPRFFDTPFSRIFPWNRPNQDKREDTDLDGKISGSDAVDLIKKSSEKEPQNSPSRGFFSGSSVTMTTVRGPDGKIEHKKVVRDSTGREESTVSRTLGGQSHTVTTIIGPDGLEEKREDFKNLDQNDINTFEEKWHSQQPPQQSSNPALIKPPRPHIIRPSPRLDSDDMDMMSKYFRDPPK